MNNTEYIEKYFRGTNSESEKQQFEKKILEDASFASEVAFYISANKLIEQELKEEKKHRFRKIYEEHKVVPIKQPFKNMRHYLVAASIIFLIILSALFLFESKTSPSQIANEYIEQNWKTLAITMGSQDSLESGLGLYNSGKLPEALAIFETLAKSSANAKKYAGIVTLRLQNYTKAIEYFSLLEADTSLYSNPGKFYKAITLMKRDKDGDKETARLLLQEVINNDMEGKSEAQKWVKKL